MSSRAVQETVLRDFGGGWNVADIETSLNSKFQPVSENTVRGTDGSIAITHGDELFADLDQGLGTVATYNGGATINAANNSRRVTITATAHGLLDGQFVTFTNGPTVGSRVLTGPYRIYVSNANTFSIHIPLPTTSAVTSLAGTINVSADSRFIKGEAIYGRYFNRELVVFLDDGEIVSIDATGTPKLVWSAKQAFPLTLEAWGPTDRVSAEVIKGTLIACNGAENDKPLVYNGTTFNYLVDGASLSNAAVPRAEYVIAANRYTMFVNTEYGPTRVEISAKNTTGTFSREPDPAGAVEIDVGMLTQTVDPKLTGAGVLRDKVFLTFYDTSMLGTVGIMNGEVHEPDFSDVISLFGAFSHNTIVSLGNDIFCASNNGVVSVSVSALSGTFVPDPISELIRPAYASHISRLSEDDLRLRTFAVFNSDDRQYMLFIPKYSLITKTCENDPILLTQSLGEFNLAILNAPNHQMEEMDWIDITGVEDIGALPASKFNGRRQVRKVINENQILVEFDSLFPISATGGGDAVEYVPVNDETICYSYTYNPAIKLRRWTRLRGMNYRWATRSQKNAIFMGRGKKIYRLGTISHPIPVRDRNNYDFRNWSNSFDYQAGDRVRLNSKAVYRCLIPHTSAATGSFQDDLDTRPSLWLLYFGDPIDWEVETPWSDFGDRTSLKQIKRVHFDTTGSSAFTFEIYTDGVYRDPLTNVRTPLVSTEFIGHDGAGFGEADAYFGSGRRTAEEWLWASPARGKMFKLRFAGSSLHPLTISAVSLSYLKGSALA